MICIEQNMIKKELITSYDMVGKCIGRVNRHVDENKTTSSAQQIHFVQHIIAHIEQNGYMDDPAMPLKPPFDRPISFVIRA